MFDWQIFLSRHNIPFVLRGPNISRGEIGVRCPWCGAADPSEHMSIGIRGYSCRRNRAHSGRSRAWLVSALLGCSLDEARRLTGTTTFGLVDDGAFLAKVRGYCGVSEGLPRERFSLSFPLEIGPLDDLVSKRPAPFWEYLCSRGYGGDDLSWVAYNYKLHYVVSGDFRWRVIIPVYDIIGRLVTWTGRAISSTAQPRYKTLSRSNGALEATSDLLLGLPLLYTVKHIQLLVVCEGPFDAMRISTLGHSIGVYGTCLFGLNISASQVLLLDEFRNSRCSRIALLLDNDAKIDIFRLACRLPFDVSFLSLPEEYKDAGDLPAEAGRGLIETWI
jgi:hypothetical protein